MTFFPEQGPKNTEKSKTHFDFGLFCIFYGLFARDTA